jgi:hypothetical protein
VKEGKFPKGFRLLYNLRPEKLKLFRKEVIKHFFEENYRPAEF